MNLPNHSDLWKSALIVYYDLEFSGNIRLDFGKQCSIHEIAAQSKNDRFFCCVNPYLTKEIVEPPVDPKYHMPSQQELEQMQALSFPTAYDQFVSFIYRLLLKRKKKWVCLVSHNGFRGDKIVFEHEIVFHRLPPVPFFFFDSLLYLREVNPGLASYSLPNIYGELFGSVYKAHSAYTDTEALQKIVKHIGQPLHGVLYPMHTIPWRNVGGVGYHTEQTFLQHRLPDLTALFRLCRGNQQATKYFLQQRGIDDRATMHSYTLLLLCLAEVAAAVCFGPCNEAVYEIRSGRQGIEIECSRNYQQRRESRSCQTDMTNTWTLASASVNEFSDMERSYEEEGREGAERACEKVCAATNSCRAFGVSSDVHVSEGAWQCTIFYTCLQTQFNEHLDLFQREEPFECLVKTTSFDGVFVNFIESNGVVSQTSRLLSLESKPFYDLHVMVNGEFNKTYEGFRPYKTPQKTYCDEYDSDCVILHAGGYSAAIVALFCCIVAFNSCVLYVSFTKASVEAPKRPIVRLRKPLQEKKQYSSTLRTRSSRINF